MTQRHKMKLNHKYLYLYNSPSDEFSKSNVFDYITFVHPVLLFTAHLLRTAVGS